jgi:hypothetical protein
MQGLQVRRKHQVEEWKVEGTIGFLISFVICCLFFIGGMGEGEGGGALLMALLYLLYDLDGGQD